MSNLTTSLLRKWHEQGFRFVRFKNGCKLDLRRANLEWVNLVQLILHFDDWVADWDLNLTPGEEQLVRSKAWRDDLVRAIEIAPEAFAPAVV